VSVSLALRMFTTNASVFPRRDDVLVQRGIYGECARVFGVMSAAVGFSRAPMSRRPDGPCYHATLCLRVLLRVSCRRGRCRAAYGFEKPSAIQKRAIMPVLRGRDTIAQAQSGTGKTGTFTISILQKITIEDQSCQVRRRTACAGVVAAGRDGCAVCLCRRWCWRPLASWRSRSSRS
jgi:hypothetical protein